MRLRLPVVLFAVGVSFAAGLVSSARWAPWGVRDARAQAAPFAASVYVPSDGLAFRTFDGRLAAKLGYDGHGGFFELYDEHEQPQARVRGDGLARPGLPAGPGTGPAVVPPAAPLGPPVQRSRGDDLGF
jgi:hypothetical protein